MITTIGKIRRLVYEALAPKPIETRLQQLALEAQTSGHSITIDVHFGTFQEFNREVRKVTAMPNGQFEFFAKDGSSIGTFTLDQLLNDYE